MKLISAPGSCSTASQIALEEAGADVEIVKLDLRGDRKLPDGRHLNEINPKGYVPVLELDDGSYLTENAAVLLYIADKHPDAHLAPDCKSEERYRLQEWLALINSEVHKAIGQFFNPSLPDAMRPIITSLLDKRYRYIDEKLAGQEYLMGDTFTVADCYLFVVSSWAPHVDYDLSSFDQVRNWQDRVASRDAVQRVMKAI